MSSEEPFISISSQTGPQPDEIARRTFPSVRKGVDGEAVRHYLETVADELRAVLDREQGLKRRLAEAERRAAEPELDEQTLLRAVGVETARIIQTAHTSAADVIAKAEGKAAEIIAAAEAVLGERTAIAQAEASEILDGAERRAAAMTEAAEQEATRVSALAAREAEELTEATRSEAVALLDATRGECRRVVSEARELRASVLGDLAARRRSLRVQLEQLRTGRDSLLNVVDAVGDAVDQLRDRLANAEHEARLAAAEAGERVAAGEPGEEALPEDETLAESSETLDQLEAAIDSSSERDETAEVAAVLSAVAADSVIAAQSRDGDESGDDGPVAAPPGAASSSGPDDNGQVQDGADEPDPDGPGRDELEGEDAGTALYDEEAELAAEQEAVTSHRSVDELFAKIRASRSTGPAESTGEVDAGEAAELAAEAAVVGELADPTEPGAVADQIETSAASEAIEEEAAAETDGAEAAAELSADAALLALRAELIEPITKKLSKALKRTLQDDQNILLDALRNGSGAPSLEASLPESDQRGRIEDATSELLSEAWMAGHGWLEASEPTDGEVATAGRTLAGELALEVTTLLRHRLAEALSSIENGDGATDVASTAYREWRGARVEATSADYTVRAFSNGAVTGGIGGPVKWVVDDDGQPCPDCDDNALAGTVIAGEEFPTGQLHPPVHPGCRCLIVSAT